MKMYAIFWGLVAVSAAFGAEPSAITLPDGGVVLDPSAITMPGAIVMLGYMLGKWTPTLRVELVDSRD